MDPVQYYDQNAEQFDAYYRHNPSFRERSRIWTELLDKYARKGDLAIDIGCGTGVFSIYLASRGLRVIGLDAAPGMIAICDRKKRELSLERVDFVCSPISALQAGPRFEMASLIISSSVLEYVEDFHESLALLGEQLLPGGHLVISLPNESCINRKYQRLKFSLTKKPEVYRYIRHMTTPVMLASQLQRHGLLLLEQRYYEHEGKISRVGRALRLPLRFTEDLFVAVFGKR